MLIGLWTSLDGLRGRRQDDPAGGKEITQARAWSSFASGCGEGTEHWSLQRPGLAIGMCDYLAIYDILR